MSIPLTTGVPTAQDLADDVVEQLGLVSPRKVSVEAVQRLVRQRLAHLTEPPDPVSIGYPR